MQTRTSHKIPPLSPLLLKLTSAVGLTIQLPRKISIPPARTARCMWRPGPTPLRKWVNIWSMPPKFNVEPEISGIKWWIVLFSSTHWLLVFWAPNSSYKTIKSVQEVHPYHPLPFSKQLSPDSQWKLTPSSMSPKEMLHPLGPWGAPGPAPWHVAKRFWPSKRLAEILNLEWGIATGSCIVIFQKVERSGKQADL